MTVSLLAWVVVGTLLPLVTCDLKCDQAKTCGQCIGHSYECVWCSAKDHKGKRCDSKANVNATWCGEKVVDPRVGKVFLLKNERIRNDASKVVQLQPQEMKIRLRPGQIMNFTVKYRPAKDYPLDVYYILDYSYTMRHYIGLLQEQGIRVHEHLSTFTNNVRIGVGSFVEKPAIPYAGPFQTSYAFKNHLSLTNNPKQIKEALKNSVPGANFDDPEAALDALMQAMVCKERLAWREGARRIIVLCTDATYHSAGDGKMAGAAKLNDMQCHLNASDYYDKELLLDYPSVNQITKIAKQENIIIIFNVINTVESEYIALANRIGGGATYVELKKHSNIVDTVTNVYTSAVRGLQIDVNIPDHAASMISVKLTPDCTQESACKVEHHEDFIFSVSLTSDSCLYDNNIITIKPNGLEEELRIQVETYCQCECEKSGDLNSRECSNSGTYQCGICKCNENSFGDVCQCTGASTASDREKCKAPRDTVVCSGHGTCTCDRCACSPGFSGDLCQYDDNGCPLHQGQLCGGMGRCTLGHCVCAIGWTGDDCHCPISDAKCRVPHSGSVCSGNGDCICGECNCTRLDSQNKRYTGIFCDKCFECDEKRCKDLEKYAQCVYFKNQTVCDKEFKTTSEIKVIMVNKTEFDGPEYHLAKLCKILLDDGKSILFRHNYEDRMLHLIIQKDLEEPDRANMWIAIGSSIGGILLLGLLAVIAWKILVDIHDSREYKRFCKQLDESADPSNLNPFYKEPTVQFTNPAFNRRSRVPS